MRDARIPHIVIPAQAGIHLHLTSCKMDPRSVTKISGDDASFAETITVQAVVSSA
jgi:hypothetical protein